MTNPIRVLNTFPLDPGQRRRLDGVSPRLRISHVELDGRAGIDAIVDDRLEVLFADSVPSDLSRVPALRWFQYSGAGVDPLAMAAPWDHGIVVTTASGANCLQIGEYVMAALLQVAQLGAERAENQRRRRWQWDDAREALIGRSLRGATLVLVGYGSIGREIARLASAFQMRVLAVKARPDVRADEGWCIPGTGDPEGRLPERIVGPEDLDDVVGSADYVVATVPSTSATRAILGRRALAAMPERAWLVNVGRGDLFDEEELVAALRDRRIAGATLDVTPAEPLPADSPLWDLPNVVVTPHVSGGSSAYWEPLSELFAENLRRYVAGEPLLNAYRPDLEY